MSTEHTCLRLGVRQSVRTLHSKLIWMEFQMRWDRFRLKSMERFLGLSNPPPKGEC